MERDTVGGSVTGATVSGGGDPDNAGPAGNHVTSSYATIGGGRDNTAGGVNATVGGGIGNNADGVNSTVPGGIMNDAAGGYSFAAGSGARALHSGSFVWADSTGATPTVFESTDENQFLIRASGGVGIGTADPVTELHVLGKDPFGTFGGQLRIEGTTATGAEGTGG